MASVKERAGEQVLEARERRRLLDHLVRTVGHYGKVNGNAQAGAVTYFGFLSFFPIMALAFWVIGLLAQVFPDAHDQLLLTLDAFLPGMIGDQPGQIPLSTFEDNASTVGLLGLVGLLYSGLGWLSGMRSALETMFGLPKREQPGFVSGKARDLVTLVTLGVVLIVSVALSGAVSRLSQQILDWVHLGDSLLAFLLLWAIGHVLGIAAAMGLFLAMFHLLARPHLPRHALVQGAFLGALGFEVLKALAAFLIAGTQGNPAFQAFGVALILLVWINYFSRITMYGASWAHTTPQVERAHVSEHPVVAARAASAGLPVYQPVPARRTPWAGRVAAAAGVIGLVALARRRRRTAD